MNLIPLIGLIGFLGSGLLLVGAYRMQRRDRVPLGFAASFVPSPEVMRKPDPTDEANMPRWRRPSVLAARASTRPSTRVASFASAATAAFPVGRRRGRRFKDGAPKGPRALSRYDDVTILDQPSEAYGLPLGNLVADDEVVVLERDEIWAKVATPDGKTGWVLGMTLETKGRRKAQ